MITGARNTEIPEESWTGITVFSKRQLPYGVGQQCQPFTQEARREMELSVNNRSQSPSHTDHHLTRQFDAVETAHLWASLHTHPHTHTLPLFVFSSLAHATREGVKSRSVVSETERNGSLDMQAGLCIDWELTSRANVISSRACEEAMPYLLEVVYTTGRPQRVQDVDRSFATEWVYPTKDQAHGAVKKDFDALTENDFIEHAEALHQSRLDEVSKLFKLSCFRRLPRSQCTNVVDSKWVYRWKPSDAGRVIKSRITLRGFKDLDRSVNTWAATAARNTQKTLNSLAMTQANFTMESWDISSAFAQGMTFEEIATATGEEQRSIQLEVAPYDLDLIRAQPGFEDFSCHQEVLDLLKPVYGLRDAPRCWQLKLQGLMQRCGLQQSLCDSQLYVLRLGALSGSRYSHASQALKTQNPLAVVIANTVHVDDIKVVGLRSEMDLLASRLEAEVGKLKKQGGTFMH
eukprot:2610307-Amphidinium_carterae.1